MDDRTTIAAMALQGLLSSAAAFCETPEELPTHQLVRIAVRCADELLNALQPPQEQEGDPYEREKAAAAAIEDDRPF